MGIVQLPAGRLAGQRERMVFRRGQARLDIARPVLRVIGDGLGARFCAACAAPTDSGVVWRAGEPFCSVECSLGGDRPA